MPNRWGSCEGSGRKERSMSAAPPGAHVWAPLEGSSGVRCCREAGVSSFYLLTLRLDIIPMALNAHTHPSKCVCIQIHWDVWKAQHNRDLPIMD